MCDKIYTNYTNSNSFNRASCAKQNLTTNQFYQYTNNTSNNTYNNNTNLNDNYVLGPQQQQYCYNYNTNNNKNICMYSNNTELTTNWENRSNNTNNDDLNQLKMIEITSKDLSPTTSYCSNLDLYITNDFYKTQWNYNQQNHNYNQQKFNDYPNCEPTHNYYPYQYPINDNNYNEYNYHSNNSYYQGYNNFEQPIETNNTPDLSDESDIIVEDDEFNDYQYNNNSNNDNIGDNKTKEYCLSERDRCIICNIRYIPLDKQFYLITKQSPLSMTTQQPIYRKLYDLFGRITTKIYLCDNCLNLINTIDHLQHELDGYKVDLLRKFRASCRTNRVKLPKKRVNYNRVKLYKCRWCCCVLNYKQLCLNHIKKHKLAGYLCEICGRTFRKRLLFETHRKQHEDSLKIMGYKCCNCSRLFRTRSNCKEHENYCLNRLPYSCKNCHKCFTTITKLRNHCKLKHDKKFKSICSICNIGFVKLSDYKSHKISHSTEKKYPCNQCDKQYKTLSNLNYHKKSHNQQLPFVCKQCNKGFMRKDYLEAHINNHLGRKDYLCTACNKRFVSQKNLYTHCKYHHHDDEGGEGGGNLKQCNLCGKMMNINNYVEHLRIHNNLKEFECDLCENRFNTKTTLAKHKKRKHSK